MLGCLILLLILALTACGREATNPGELSEDLVASFETCQPGDELYSDDTYTVTLDSLGKNEQGGYTMSVTMDNRGEDSLYVYVVAYDTADFEGYLNGEIQLEDLTGANSFTFYTVEDQLTTTDLWEMDSLYEYYKVSISSLITSDPEEAEEETGETPEVGEVLYEEILQISAD